MLGQAGGDLTCRPVHTRGGHARGELREVADLYGQEAEALQAGLEDPPEGAEWSQAARDRAIELLTRCTGLEADAIRKLRRALGAM